MKRTLYIIEIFVHNTVTTEFRNVEKKKKNGKTF